MFDIVKELNKHINHKNLSYRICAQYILSLHKKKMPLPKIEELSLILNTSTATISRFVKYIHLPNYGTLRFLVDN